MAHDLWSLNRTHELDSEFYNWCAGYHTGPVIWSIISMLCFLIGFPANVWVLHELLKRQRQRSNSEIFVLSLALFDLLFTALIPLCVYNFMIWHIKELHISFFFWYSLSLIGRPLFMACICWDCYMAVVYPIVYKTSMKFIFVKKAITVTTCFGTLVSGVCISTTIWQTLTPAVVFPLIVALPIIFFCDMSILRALRKPDPTGNSNIHPQKKQALCTIFNSFIMTFVVYLPPMTIFLFGKMMKLGDIVFFCDLITFAISFFTVGCVIMPVLYLIRIGKLVAFKNRWKSRHT